jgi:hypothetical protein
MISSCELFASGNETGGRRDGSAVLGMVLILTNWRHNPETMKQDLPQLA